MKVSGNESLTYGTFVPGNESSRVRKFHNSTAELQHFSFYLQYVFLWQGIIYGARDDAFVIPLNGTQFESC